jgi:8-oxo-dGTP pyrophosphatase MutT (NUDIX family)
VSWTTLVGVSPLVVKDGRLLMVLQRRPYGVHWEAPSGYYEAGESLEEAAAREALEEAGVEVDVGAFVCTFVWERETDHRRNVLVYFEGAPRDSGAQPRPQTEEDIEAADYVDPYALEGGDLHPICRAILDRWWRTRETGFQIVADALPQPDGTQTYSFRS